MAGRRELGAKKRKGICTKEWRVENGNYLVIL